MMNFFDRAALVDRFARMVPWTLAESLLREQQKEIGELGPMMPEVVERFGEMMEMEPSTIRAMHGILWSRPDETVSEDDTAAVCRALAHLWLKSLVEVRDLVDDPTPVELGHDLFPDSAMVDDEICKAARSMIEMLYQTLSVDRIRTLYAAFVEALRAKAADATERVQISDTTVLSIDHGRFTLERVEHATT